MRSQNKNCRFLLFPLGLIGMTALIIWLSLFVLAEDLSRLDNELLSAQKSTLSQIKRCSWDRNSEILILGDSIAKQMFCKTASESGLILNAADNGLTTMAGYYILCHEFLRQKNGTLQHPLDVILMAHPTSLNQPFIAPNALGYNLLPWKAGQTWNLLDQQTQFQLYELFGVLCHPRFPLTTLAKSACLRRAYLRYWQFDKDRLQITGTDLGSHWLPRLEELCRQHHAQLHLLSTPLPDNKENRAMFDSQCAQLKQNSTSGSGQLLEQFARSVVYLPTQYFLDGRHFTKEHEERRAMRSIIGRLSSDSAIKRCLELTRFPGD